MNLHLIRWLCYRKYKNEIHWPLACLAEWGKSLKWWSVHNYITAWYIVTLMTTSLIKRVRNEVDVTLKDEERGGDWLVYSIKVYDGAQGPMGYLPINLNVYISTCQVDGSYPQEFQRYFSMLFLTWTSSLLSHNSLLRFFFSTIYAIVYIEQKSVRNKN